MKCTRLTLGFLVSPVLWFTQKVIDAVKVAASKRQDPKGIVMKKTLKRYAQKWLAYGTTRKEKGLQVKAEWDDVYRIGPTRSLFRIIGFYEDDSYADFIAIDAFVKHKQKLSRAESDRITEVGRDESCLSLWKKVL